MTPLIHILSTAIVDRIQSSPTETFLPIGLGYLVQHWSLTLPASLDTHHKSCHQAADEASRLAQQFGLERVVWFDELPSKWQIVQPSGNVTANTFPANVFFADKPR